MGYSLPHFISSPSIVAEILIDEKLEVLRRALHGPHVGPIVKSEQKESGDYRAHGSQNRKEDRAS